MPAKEISPEVIIADDKTTAELIIPAGCDRSMLTEQLLLGLIRGEGVEVTDFTTKAVRGLLGAPIDGEHDTAIEIARIQQPVHGVDGAIRWIVDEKNADKTTDGPTNGTDAAVCFYDRCAFVMVQAGDVVGKVTPATLGQDGRDVTGANVPARSGKDPALQLDETLMKRADGSLIAQQDGVLYREKGKAQVRKYIEIREYVDFSTGNIDFDGDVLVGRGVRDCFIVKATGNVEVRGLIEAATINAGKDLIANGGFAGRERGNALIGGCLRGRYLDNVHGHVKQDLCIDREVINCELLIDGAITSPRGSIIGGRVSPTGAVEIASLGSPAAVPTELVIGSVPALEPFARKLEQIVFALTADKAKLTDEQDIVNKLTAHGRMTATDRERQTEIMFELSTINTTLDKAQRTLDSLNDEIGKRRRVDVTVHHLVNPGSTLILDGCRYKIYNDLKGPVRFFMDGKKFVYRQGEAPHHPVADIADVSTDKSARRAA
jgi:uncharacterized protein (DUF342 family)